MKVISDLLHVKHAALFTLDGNLLRMRRRLIKGKSQPETKQIELHGDLVDFVNQQTIPRIVDGQLFADQGINEMLTEPYYYYFPCLNTQQQVIALLMISVLDKSKFVAENYGLVHVVGQRLAVELEKKKVEEEQERLSAFNAMVISSLDEVTMDYDIESGKVKWQGATNSVLSLNRESLGYSMESFLENVHRSDRDILRHAFNTLNPKAKKFDIEFQYQIKSGVYRWLRVKGVILVGGGKYERTIGVLKNIHREKIASMNRLSALIQAKDGEKKRIASEIHDSLGQTLSVARLELDNLYDMIGNKRLSVKLQHVIEMIASALTESRAISHDLMPPALTEYGLVDGLEVMLKNANRSSVINFEYLHNEIDERFDDQVESNIYRICQEAVNNILKHSQAKKAMIQLVRHTDSLYVSIEDDGVGLSNDLSSTDIGLGMSNMINRVANLGGKIDFEGNDGLLITIEILFNETENIISR